MASSVLMRFSFRHDLSRSSMWPSLQPLAEQRAGCIASALVLLRRHAGTSLRYDPGFRAVTIAEPRPLPCRD